jgi:hypothetical protein
MLEMKRRTNIGYAGNEKKNKHTLHLLQMTSRTNIAYAGNEEKNKHCICCK